MADATSTNETPSQPYEYTGDIRETVANFRVENQEADNELAKLASHEEAFVSARKEVLQEIKRTHRRHIRSLWKGSAWLRWLDAQRFLVEVRIKFTNITAFSVFVILQMIMTALVLSIIGLVVYFVVIIFMELFK